MINENELQQEIQLQILENQCTMLLVALNTLSGTEALGLRDHLIRARENTVGLLEKGCVRYKCKHCGTISNNKWQGCLNCEADSSALQRK